MKSIASPLSFQAPYTPQAKVASHNSKNLARSRSVPLEPDRTEKIIGHLVASFKGTLSKKAIKLLRIMIEQLDTPKRGLLIFDLYPREKKDPIFNLYYRPMEEEDMTILYGARLEKLDSPSFKDESETFFEYVKKLMGETFPSNMTSAKFFKRPPRTFAEVLRDALRIFSC
ncbi:MAG: hypothetical protein ACK551_07825 [Vampirovibrionales bacterium]